MNIKDIVEKLGGIKPVRGEQFSPLSEEEIGVVEKMINGHFSDDYRFFLSSYGASLFKGESEENPYVVFSSIEELPAHITSDGFALVDAFYGASNEGPYSLATRVNFFRGRMPESIIPIADDGGSGQICLGIRNTDEGKIFYWDQQGEALSEEEYLEDFDEPRPEQAMYENMYLIANSFCEFLNALQKRK